MLIKFRSFFGGYLVTCILVSKYPTIGGLIYVCDFLHNQFASLWDLISIYRLILKDKVAGGSLHQYLRHQGKKYRKRYGKNDCRGHIPNRVDIDDRPSIVDSRSRIGDWEADCVIGKGHQGVFSSLAERKSRLYLALRIKNETAKETNATILRLLENMKQYVITLTFDNGRELNEHHNGLLRQFFPKQMPIASSHRKRAVQSHRLNE